MKKVIGLLGLIFFISSCNVQKALIEKWSGKTKQELIQTEGPPSWTDSDGNGGQVLVYEKTNKKPVSRGANGRTWIENVLHKDKTMYYINQDKKIYNVVYKSEPLE